MGLSHYVMESWKIIPSTCRSPLCTSLTPCFICARKYPLLPFIGLKLVAIISIYLLYAVLRQLLLIVLLEFALLIQILRQYNQSRIHLERKLIENEKRFHHIDPDVMKYYAL